MAGLEPSTVERGVPRELVHPGAGTLRPPRLGESDVRKTEEEVGGGGGEELARSGIALAVSGSQPVGKRAVDTQREVHERVVEHVEKSWRDEEETVFVGIAAEHQLNVRTDARADSVHRVLG